jgi:hypothetical protein
MPPRRARFLALTFHVTVTAFLIFELEVLAAFMAIDRSWRGHPWLRRSMSRRLNDRPIHQTAHGHVDFDLGTVDEGNVDLFEVIVQHVMNDRRGIDARPRERSEE